jgi:methylated-DNA-[protein]-cysteine S-methyltransferase
VPLIVPCHRVVGSSGKLGGFSAPQGLQMKRRLLRLEGSLPRGS